MLCWVKTVLLISESMKPTTNQEILITQRRNHFIPQIAKALKNYFNHLQILSCK